MKERLNSSTPYILSIVRFVIGALFLSHGIDKVTNGMLTGHPLPPMPLLHVAGYIELTGGALITVGLLTRLASFICCGEMAVAYFMAHAPHGFLPIVNHGELAVLYCFSFLLFVVTGPGAISIDALLLERSSQ